MNRDFWEKNAAPWSRAIREQLVESRKTTNPAILQEVLKLKPRSVIDVGCGEGWIASELLPRGIEYVGVDFSKPLVESARRSYPEAVFEVASYEELAQGQWQGTGERRRKFDLAVFNFSLFDEKLAPILKAIARLLEPKGSILIQTLHPCYVLNPYEDAWRSEDFKAFPLPFQGEMPWYGHTLGSWVDEIQKSGLILQSVVEPLSPATKTPLSLILALRQG